MDAWGNTCGRVNPALMVGNPHALFSELSWSLLDGGYQCILFKLKIQGQSSSIASKILYKTVEWFMISRVNYSLYLLL